MDSARAARLLSQLLDGRLRQNVFQPAEFELLLEIVEHPHIPRRMLRRYQQLIAHYASGATSSAPTLREFVEDEDRRKAVRAALRSHTPPA